MTSGQLRATGSCLCGGVRYQVHGELAPASACHCSQCAKTSGNYVVSANCDNTDLVLTSKETLRWYRSSPGRRRGFCRKCGSSLFWEPMPTTHISISAGSLDRPTGLKVVEHIFLAQKGDYYEVNFEKNGAQPWACEA